MWGEMPRPRREQEVSRCGAVPSQPKLKGSGEVRGRHRRRYLSGVLIGSAAEWIASLPRAAGPLARQLHDVHEARFICTRIDGDVPFSWCDILKEQHLPYPGTDGAAVAGVRHDVAAQYRAEQTPGCRMPDAVRKVGGAPATGKGHEKAVGCRLRRP